MGVAMKYDREVALSAVKSDPRILQFLIPDLRSDREIVLAAVEKDGLALEFADDDLRRDHEIVLAAVTQNPGAVGLASVCCEKETVNACWAAIIASHRSH